MTHEHRPEGSGHSTRSTASDPATTAGPPAATTSAPAATTTSAPAVATSTSTAVAASAGCAITPSAVGEIYATPNPVGASTSVPVASYPVMKSEQVPFGGGSIQWYEISVQGRLVWINDEPGQLDADTCGPP